MSELRYAVADEGGQYHKLFDRCLNGGSVWSIAMKEVGKILDVPDMAQYVTSKRKLYIPLSVFNQLDTQTAQAFRYDAKVGYHTPRLNLKTGKQIHAKFLDVMSKFDVGNVPELEEILQALRMVNRPFYSGYRNVMLIEVEKRFYLRWEGDPTPSTQLTEVDDPTLIKDVEEAIAEATA